MTSVAFPRPARIRATNFYLQRIQARNPLRGGNHQAVDVGEPIWVCEIDTAPLSREQGGAFKAFLARLRGAMRTTFLWDASRPRPLAYLTTADLDAPLASSTSVKASSTTIPASATTTSPAWGSPVIAELDSEASMIRVTGFVAGASISEGDYGAWDDGFARRLHIVVEAATADADGEAWLRVEPAPPAYSASLPAGFAMEKASAEMVVMTSSIPYSAPVTHQLTLQAAQIFRQS